MSLKQLELEAVELTYEKMVKANPERESTLKLMRTLRIQQIEEAHKND